MNTSYSENSDTDRAAHIWRYTPWKKAHPTGKISQIPSADSPILSLSMSDGSEVPTGIRVEEATTDDLLRLGHDLDFGDGTAAPTFIAEIVPQIYVLRVDAKTITEAPVILSVKTSGSTCACRLLLDICERVEIELVTVLEGDAEWCGFLREGSFGQASIVNDVVVHVTGKRLLRCDSIRSNRDAQIRAGTVNAASSQAKVDVRHWLPEPGASLQVNGSILAARKDHLDSHVEILHSGKQTFSRLEWHTACGGQSVTTGTGMLRIDAGAKGGDAGQLFHNLLLSDKAKANSIPELEVMENEVVGCGHGTANGPLDEYQMFYLKARGFDEEQARAALIAAFLNAPLSNMGSETLHGWLINRIESHLSGL
tara:strand:+ start:1345 stop:2448 length:1104 start_codon:yes stop_codon:yes gene_type:complete